MAERSEAPLGAALAASIHMRTLWLKGACHHQSALDTGCMLCLVQEPATHLDVVACGVRLLGAMPTCKVAMNGRQTVVENHVPLTGQSRYTV